MTVWREWQGRNIHFLVSSAESAECRVQKEQKEHATRNSFCAKENANEKERWSFAKNSPENSPEG